MKFPVLIRSDEAGSVYKVVVPDLCLKLFSRTPSHSGVTVVEQVQDLDIVNIPVTEEKAIDLLNIGTIKNKASLERAITAAMVTYLAANQKVAASVVATSKDIWAVKEEQYEGSLEWLEIDVEIKIANKCLSVSSQLLPILSSLAFLATIGTGVYLDILITEMTANIKQFESIASTSYDVLNGMMFYIISETPQNMELLNRKIIAALSCGGDSKSSYQLAEDFTLQTMGQTIISYLTSWKTYVALPLLALAGYNYYVGVKSDYDVELSYVEQAKTANLTALSLPILKTLTNVSFGIGKVLDFVITGGEFIVAAKGANYLAKQAKSYLEPVGRCFRFFSCTDNGESKSNSPSLLTKEEKITNQEQETTLSYQAESSQEATLAFH